MQETTSLRVQVAALRPASRFATLCALTAALVCIDLAWLVLAGWSVSARGFVLLALAVAACLAPLTIRRYRRDARIGTTAQFSALLLIFQAAAATLSYLTISTNAPLIDPALAAWDRALGFDWLALASWLDTHSGLRSLLRCAYYSGLFQLAFAVVFLGFTARRDRLEEFVRLMMLATLATIALSGPFPAAGAWKQYAVGGSFDLSSLSHFEPLRDGRLSEVALETMQGLISIPSLHAAMAVLLMHAARGIRFVWPASLVLNLAMLASTPTEGGHYLVDVFAGSALALGLIGIGLQRNTRPAARPQVPAQARHFWNLQ
jgi:hypothetical protein